MASSIFKDLKMQFVIASIIIISIVILVIYFTVRQSSFLSKDESVPKHSFSGAADEWRNVVHTAATSKSSLASFKALQIDTSLYFLVTGSQLNVPGTTFYIDSDNHSATGYHVDIWRNSSGMDYKIVDDELFKYKGGEWENAGKVEIVKRDDVIEGKLDISQLELTSSQRMNMGFYKDGNSMLPEAGQPLLVVDTADETFGPDVSFHEDGKVNWEGIDAVAVSADLHSKMYAVMVSGMLHILVTGKIEGGGIFINTDNSHETGFQSWAWPEFGGDYLIEGDTLFKSKGNDWQWDMVSNVTYTATGEGDERTIEVSVPVSSLELSAGINIQLAFSAGETLIPAPVPEPYLPAIVYPSLPTITEATGDPARWLGLNPLAKGTGVLDELYAFVRGSNLHVLVIGTDFTAEKNLFINVDNNTETGYSGWQHPNCGADFLIQNGYAWRSTGTGWNWESMGPAYDPQTVITSEFAPEGKQVMEMIIDMSDWNQWADVTTNIRMTQGIGGDYAPPTTSDKDFTLPAAVKTSGLRIAIDGITDDWAEIDAEAKASGVAYELKAVQDDKKLYVMVTGENLNTQNVFYIDTVMDDDAEFISSHWMNSRTNYKVEYNTLYRYNATAATAHSRWEEVGPVNMEVTPTSINMSLYLDMIDKQNSKAIKIGYVSKNAFLVPAQSQEMMTVDKQLKNKDKSKAFYPRESFEALNNPFMGWVPWTTHSGDVSQPYSLMYAGITWREIEPVKEQFDWEGIETKYNLNYWGDRGKKVILRLILTYPTGTNTPDRKDIPDWLYDELVEAEGAENAGKWFASPDIGNGFAPNYSSPVLIREHERLIKAMAERYDNDPRIAFIQIGSLGQWGEFHNWPEDLAGKFPNVSISDQYIQHYVDHFKNKLSGVRKPFPIAREHQLGLFNDVFGAPGDDWLKWTQQGWDGIKGYIAPVPGETTEELAARSEVIVADSAMPDFWKTNFSGGEFHSGNPRLSLDDRAIMETLRQLRDGHTSWIGLTIGAVEENIQANLDLLLKTMGYRYVIESVTHVPKAKAGKTIEITLDWANKGIAPMYYKWPLTFALADHDGNIVPESITAQDNDIRLWLPGKFTVTSSLHIPKHLVKGNYTVLVSIIDPDTGEPGISLAIEGKRSDGWYELDSIAVK
ncbi:DUF4832 domain-containing protein [Paenibacillus sp. IITD108]|uniref:DUF4832 domain-containing protein n=1 Tax=Paenibacillus sp. IITD108 TaxID=3116649 RepID=UPI002F3EA940